jgi:hypothetical protein
MPYIFLSSSFVLKGLNITRTTNGSIQNHFKHKKSKITSALLPFDNTNLVYKSTQGKAIEFINLKSKNTEDSLEDILEEIEDKEEVEDNDDYDDLVAEVFVSEAREAWKKLRKDCKHLPTKNKGERFFQKSYLYTNSGK